MRGGGGGGVGGVGGGVWVFFFFKQKTAYEIKECDWSSDVCSSDLVPLDTLLRGCHWFSQPYLESGCACRDRSLGP